MRSKNVISIVILFCLFFFCNSAFARLDGRPNACKSNIREIKSAIEIYAMDHPDFIPKVDDEIISILIKGNYLKALTKPDSKCKYKSMGNNVLEDGIIYCVYHGDVERLVKCEYYKFDEYEKLPQDVNDQEFKENVNRIREIRQAELKRLERVRFERDLQGYVAYGIAILCFIIDSILLCVLIFRWLKAIVVFFRDKTDWKR